jgi:hypothetical protein
MSEELGKNLEKSGKQNAETDNHTHQPKSSISPAVSNESGLPPNVPPAIQSQNKSANHSNPRKAEPPNWCDILTLILEIFGIIGLFIYCVYTIKEWKTFDSERETMENEFVISQANFRQDERAWLAAVSISQIVSQDKQNGIFSILFKNTGKTPALNVQAVTSWTMNVATIPKYDGVPAPRINSGITAPEQNWEAQSATISAKIMSNISNGEPLYLYGTVWYDDIFGNHHWTQFCAEVERSSINNVVIQFLGAPFHNSCDQPSKN